MDTGSSAFILICSAMVCLMTPALAFFYGGLGRRKNVINTMMMSVLPLAIASLLWVVTGYSLSFGGHGYFFGNISHLFLHGVSETASSRGLAIPDLLFAAFQMMFSIICVAILTGSVVGRMRFTPLAIFVVFWLLLVYYPFAHMVWGDGILAKWGTIDFAGGDVVHITSGVSALVLAIVVGKRRDYGILEHRPHNVPFVLLGAGLLWFGWFGFNAGGTFRADYQAAAAFGNTFIALAVAMITWLSITKLQTKKIEFVDILTGSIAGLATITPCAGYVSFSSAFCIGLIESIICYLAVNYRKKKQWDDALDVWGVHGIGGFTGTILVGVFATRLSLFTTTSGVQLFFVQLLGVMFVAFYAFVLTTIMLKIMKKYTRITPSSTDQKNGLDFSFFN